MYVNSDSVPVFLKKYNSKAGVHIFLKNQYTYREDKKPRY